MSANYAPRSCSKKLQHHKLLRFHLEAVAFAFAFAFAAPFFGLLAVFSGASGVVPFAASGAPGAVSTGRFAGVPFFEACKRR